MNPVLAYLKAFRYQNLLIIVLTMYLMRWCIMKPFLELHQLQLQMSEKHFGLLVLSTVLVAAGGYLINDYFDLKIDRINKPEKIVVGRYIKRRVAIVLHWAIHFIGFSLGVYVAWKAGHWQLALIHLFWILAMWFYSTDLKRMLVVGNLIIALCLALVPLSVVLFEIPMLIGKHADDLKDHPQAIPMFKQFLLRLFYWVLGFSLFAFLLSLAREITKDAADIKGDKTYGCKSIPINFGMVSTKWIVVMIYLIIAVAIFTIQQTILNDRLTFLYMLVGILPLLVLSAAFTLRAKGRKGFLKASNLNKLTSLVGVLYALLVNYILTGSS